MVGPGRLKVGTLMFRCVAVRFAALLENKGDMRSQVCRMVETFLTFPRYQRRPHSSTTGVLAFTHKDIQFDIITDWGPDPGNFRLQTHHTALNTHAEHRQAGESVFFAHPARPLTGEQGERGEPGIHA